MFEGEGVMLWIVAGVLMTWVLLSGLVALMVGTAFHRGWRREDSTPPAEVVHLAPTAHPVPSPRSGASQGTPAAL